ncbi:MAG: hypothetical protein WAL38_27605, partial [Solirubrobacteraceae bacterium]
GHAVRAIPVPLAHENHHGPTGVACELDSRRENLASTIGSIAIQHSALPRREDAGASVRRVPLLDLSAYRVKQRAIGPVLITRTSTTTSTVGVVVAASRLYPRGLRTQ